MASRQPGLRWLLALLLVIALAFAAVGDWVWTGVAVLFGVVLVLRSRRAAP